MSPKKSKPGRARKYAAGTTRQEKKRLRKLEALGRTGVDTTLAKEDTRPDKELLADMIGRFDMLKTLTRGCTTGKVPSVIVPGAPGIGKTYNVDQELAVTAAVHVRVSGTISSIELYKLAFRYRLKGQVIVIDDGDKVFRDEDTLNLLKAMTDSGRRRVLNWRTNSEFLVDDQGEVDRTFEYEGSVIFLSNINFQENVDAQRGRNWEHMEALISRSLYLDLRVHNRRAISLWITHVCTEGKMFELEGVPEADGKILLKWLHTEQSKLREFSLRTVHKLCNLWKMGSEWESAARYTLLR